MFVDSNGCLAATVIIVASVVAAAVIVVIAEYIAVSAQKHTYNNNDYPNP